MRKLLRDRLLGVGVAAAFGAFLPPAVDGADPHPKAVVNAAVDPSPGEGLGLDAVLSQSPCVVGNPAGFPAVTITSAPPPQCGGAFVGEIAGFAEDVDTTASVVVLYARTNRFYCQPYADERRFTPISCQDGTFRNDTRGGCEYWAVLADTSWSAPCELDFLPPVDGVVIQAVSQAPALPGVAISFAGETWRVKSSCCPVGPGPNTFSASAENVWVDQEGKLHLRITLRDGVWRCAEVSLDRYLGYGKYEFTVEGPVAALDPNVVFGCFSYSDQYELDGDEIDVEFSGGLANPCNAQYVVQPYDLARHRLTFDLASSPLASTHAFTWREGSVDFSSRQGGLFEQGSPIQAWTFAEPDIPAPDVERMRFNLWLLGGTPPQDGQEVEVVVADFRFTGPDSVGEPTPAQWQEQPPLPTPRRLHSAIYDLVGDQIVVFGGLTASGTRLNDTWVLPVDGSSGWTELPTAGSPPSARYDHSAIYDSIRNRMVVFGGFDGARKNDVWALTLDSNLVWLPLSTSGGSPAPRVEHSAAFDSLADRMLIFGGGAESARLNDTWELPFASLAWSPLTFDGAVPSARDAQTAAFDPLRNRMILFGGFTNASVCENDTWVLTLGSCPTWSRLTGLATVPPGRVHAAAVYDPLWDRLVLFGGATCSTPLSDAWELSFRTTPAWRELLPVSLIPPAREDHAAVQVDRRLYMVGGWDDAAPLSDTWVMGWPDITAVEPRTPGEAPPSLAVFPNPGSAGSVVEVNVRNAGHYRVSVHDVSGRLIRVLGDDHLDPGSRRLTWDGRSDRGVLARAGVYFVRVEGPDGRSVRKVVRVP